MEIFDYIVPIVAVIFWILSGFFQKKNADEEDAPPTRAPRPVADEGDLRRIQEEIRRIAQQRKKESEQPTSTPSAAPPPLPAGSKRYDLNKPYREQQHPANHYRKVAKEPVLRPESAAEIIDYQAQIDEARRKAREAKAQFEHTQADNAYRIRPAHRQRPENHATGSLKGSIHSLLQDRNSTRKAFVLKEILGSPIALRNAEQR